MRSMAPALFEQGRVHMAGTFRELEDELCQQMPGEVPSRSPDRADAAVFAIFELRHLGQGGSWLSACNKTYCPGCKATLDVRRLKCPECGHERQPEPEQEDQADGELKGWAAVYAPRKPVNSARPFARAIHSHAAITARPKTIASVMSVFTSRTWAAVRRGCAVRSAAGMAGIRTSVMIRVTVLTAAPAYMSLTAVSTGAGAESCSGWTGWPLDG